MSRTRGGIEMNQSNDRVTIAQRSLYMTRGDRTFWLRVFLFFSFSLLIYVSKRAL